MRAARAAERTLGNQLDESGFYAGQEWILLELYAAPGLSQVALAERLDVSVPAVVRSAQRLERAELVKVVPDKRDRRRRRMALTRLGTSVAGCAAAAVEEMDRMLAEGFSADEIDQLIEDLRALHLNALLTQENLPPGALLTLV